MIDRERMRRCLGLPLLVVCGLAVLAVPRVVAHDLGPVDPVLNGVLVFVPIVVWVAVVLWQRVPSPFLTLLAVGTVYGVLLAATHQVLWTQAFGGDPPRLGGNLDGALPPTVEDLVVRGFSVVSSLVTGAAVGAAAGLIGWALVRLVPAFRPRHQRE